jgi:hypothetical protein
MAAQLAVSKEGLNTMKFLVRVCRKTFGID